MKGTSGEITRPNNEAAKDGGLTHSSEEVSVMEMERRGLAILSMPTANRKREEPKQK